MRVTISNFQFSFTSNSTWRISFHFDGNEANDFDTFLHYLREECSTDARFTWPNDKNSLHVFTDSERDIIWAKMKWC